MWFAWAGTVVPLASTYLVGSSEIRWWLKTSAYRTAYAQGELRAE
jgi:hypothetical protein